MAGNTTFLMGTDDSRVDEVISIIEQHSRKRTQMVPSSTYGSSTYAAAQLSHFVVQAMLAADALPEISACELNTEHNFPDTTRKRPRYQAVFDALEIE